MRNTLLILTLSLALMFTVSVMAADRVVVVPLIRKGSADANLLPENIKSGVTIFGVTGSYVGELVISSPSTGQIWMDRNLGATNVATNYDDSGAYGDLYQWGRLADGHEDRLSPLTTTKSTTDIPDDGKFITGGDWRETPNNDLWQGVNGINNPCPGGFRLPTEPEIEAERVFWATNDRAGAFESPLKLTAGGYRAYNSGVVASDGTSGFYWTSTTSSSFARYMGTGTASASMSVNYRANGYSVRCIKD